jgi:hypothetical protein
MLNWVVLSMRGGGLRFSKESFANDQESMARRTTIKSHNKFWHNLLRSISATLYGLNAEALAIIIADRFSGEHHV